MLQKIKDALKNKYANLGFGEKAFEGVANYLSTSTTEESQIESSIQGLEVLLKGFQGETDKLRTEKSAAEKKLLELEQKANGGEPAKTEPDKPNNSSDTPEWAKALIDGQKSMSERIAKMEGEKVVLTRKQKLDAITATLPEGLRKPYGRIDIGNMSDEDFESLSNEVTKEVSDYTEAEKVRGAVLGRPMVGSKPTSKVQPTQAELDAVSKSLKI
ncbi:MAG: hypothetical protein ACRCZB_04220 [Bacteroidales bacterium]